MFTVLLSLVVLAGLSFVAYKLINKPDINNDGKVDVQDVVTAAKETVVEVKAQAVKVVEKVKKAKAAKSKK